VATNGVPNPLNTSFHAVTAVVNKYVLSLTMPPLANASSTSILVPTGPKRYYDEQTTTVPIANTGTEALALYPASLALPRLEPRLFTCMPPRLINTYSLSSHYIN
jgi:hypothetical protein